MLNDSLSNLKGSIWCVLAGKKITRFYRLSFTLLFISFLMHKWKRDLTSAFFGIWIHCVVHRNRYASVMHQCIKWMLRFLKQSTTYFWLFFLYEKDKILLLSYNRTLTLIEHPSPLYTHTRTLSLFPKTRNKTVSPYVRGRVLKPNLLHARKIRKNKRNVLILIYRSGPFVFLLPHKKSKWMFWCVYFGFSLGGTHHWLRLPASDEACSQTSGGPGTATKGNISTYLQSIKL